MIYPSSRLGSFDLPDSGIIHFPEGIYAFESQKKFCLLPLNPNIDSPMEWMHSLQSPELAFVVTDPYYYVPDYKLFLTDEDKKQILMDKDDPLAVRVIVKIPKNYADMTANMLAPIVINIKQHTAKQFVLTTLEYEVTHFLLPAELRNTKANA